MRATQWDLLADEAVGVAGAVPVLVARAHDPADVPEDAADLREHALAFDRVRLDQLEFFVSQLARLVDDLGRDPDLADVVEQRRELCVAALRARDAELVADIGYERDDVAAVLARVRVVRLDDVAEEEGGAAVRVAELERVVDARLPLAREVGEQRDQRQDGDERRRVIFGADGGQQRNRRQREIDGPDPDHEAEQAERRHVAADPVAQRRTAEVEYELGGDRRGVERERPEVAGKRIVRRAGTLIVSGLTLAAMALAFSAAPASAGLGLACPNPTGTSFMPWSDYANYAFLPDGGFEAGGSGWSLSGARVVSGNEPFYIHSAVDRRSLTLPEGASATSPAMCISLLSSKMRFIAGGESGAKVRVQIIYRGLLSSVLGILDGGTYSASGGWKPSPEIGMLGGLLPLLTSGVQFRFTAVGGDVALDDVYPGPDEILVGLHSPLTKPNPAPSNQRPAISGPTIEEGNGIDRGGPRRGL